MHRRHFLQAAAALAVASGLVASRQAVACAVEGVGAPIRLTSHLNKAVDTARDFAGQPLLVYFGYTFCPDVCPTALQTLSLAMDLAAEKNPRANEIAFLFVTFDPARDTVERMADYVAALHPALIGLTGSESQIEAVAQAWKALRFVPPHEEGSDYAVHHPASSYLLDRDHCLVKKIWFTTGIEETADRLLSVIP